jgi:hypothetical protein
LGPKSTSVDVVSPGEQTISVSVEGIPPSTMLDVVCPLDKGVADPAVSAPDASQLPLTSPDSAAPAGRNLEVLRGLSSSLCSCRNRALHLFSLPHPVRRKRLDAALLSRRLVFPSPEILFVCTQHHLLVFNQG